MECCKHCNMNNPCVYLTLKGGDQRNECSAVQNEKRLIDKACELVGRYFEGGTNMERDYWVNRFRKAMEE